MKVALVYNTGIPESHKIYYTTNNGNIVNVYYNWRTDEDGKYWPIDNYYNPQTGGVMIFNDKLTKIPGLPSRPFLREQNNLLTLKFPKTITKIGRGAFWDCENLSYINFIDLVNLDSIEREWITGTNITKVDLRNSKLTETPEYAFSTDSNKNKTINFEYILLPSTIINLHTYSFNYPELTTKTIKTLMTPTLSPTGNYGIEDQITENLIINKFDGIGHLHYFNTDCIIWVPDEWYDKYIEYYTNNTDFNNWQDIINRLKKYSDGVPEFPFK